MRIAVRTFATVSADGRYCRVPLAASVDWRSHEDTQARLRAFPAAVLPRNVRRDHRARHATA